MSFMDSWSPSPFPSSPCTPVNYPGEQFSPVDAVPAPPSSAYDCSYNNILAQLDSCGGGIAYDCSQGSAAALSPAGLDGDPLAHIPELQHEQQSPYPNSKGLSSSFQFFSHKIAVPEVPVMDITGFADMFPSAQSFSF